MENDKKMYHPTMSGEMIPCKKENCKKCAFYYCDIPANGLNGFMCSYWKRFMSKFPDAKRRLLNTLGGNDYENGDRFK